MTIAAERLATNGPGQMESHATHGEFAHPRCIVHELDPEDLQQTMCELTHDGERKLFARADEETFRLSREYLRTHGAPKGEFTTFTTGGATRTKSRRR